MANATHLVEGMTTRDVGDYIMNLGNFIKDDTAVYIFGILAAF